MKKPKVLIIGIDGATPDLIIPWCENGKLPNINRLLNNAIYGDLESTIPPITPAAWTSFLTGKNPGKHGIYDFMEKEPGTYNFRYINSKARKSSSLWKILSDHGYRVGVLNVPMTFPPEKVNGFLISGLDAPDEKSAVYPSELYKEIISDAGGFQLDIRHLGNMKSDGQRHDFISEIKDVEQQRVKLLFYLQEKYECDFLMLVFNATDQIQHHFWHYMDSSHPKYDSLGSEKFGNSIFDIYKKIDDLIGQLLSELQPTDGVILMSDHGFGPTSKYYLSTNHFFEEIGLLKFKNKGLIAGLSGKTEKFLKSILSDNQKKTVANFLPKLREKFENFNLLGSIDWSKTKAFAFELTGLAPFVWVNTGNDFPQGNVWYEREKKQILNEIEKALADLLDPISNAELGTKIYFKNNVYSGPYVLSGPDAVIESWSETGFNIKKIINEKNGCSDFFGIDDSPFISGSEWSGTHRINGFFLINGNCVKKYDKKNDIKITDIFPSVLKIFEIPVPKETDGKIIEGIE